MVSMIAPGCSASPHKDNEALNVQLKDWSFAGLGRVCFFCVVGDLILICHPGKGAALIWDLARRASGKPGPLPFDFAQDEDLKVAAIAQRT